jgi:hypothetical protein
MERKSRRNSPAIKRMTMICVSRMLSGVLKFSRRTFVEGACDEAAATVTGCNRDPAARMNQTPATKITSKRKYGK